jgi:hypothetical protein
MLLLSLFFFYHKVNIVIYSLAALGCTLTFLIARGKEMVNQFDLGVLSVIHA